MQSTKVKKITNVTHVESHFLNQMIQRWLEETHYLIQFIMDEKITRENSIFSSPKDKEKQ